MYVLLCICAISPANAVKHKQRFCNDFWLLRVDESLQSCTWERIDITGDYVIPRESHAMVFHE